MATSRPTLLVTGAAGEVAGHLLPSLASTWSLRLYDRRSTPSLEAAARAGHDVQIGDLTDRETAMRSAEGVQGILHLAGNGDPAATSQELFAPNLLTWSMILDAAVRHRVPHVVFASSVHAGGGDFDSETAVDPAKVAHPCCPYGASKVHGEALGHAVHRTSGMTVIALRLGAVIVRPRTPHGKYHWVHPADLSVLTHRALLSSRGFGIYHAVSAVAARHWSIAGAQTDLDYQPLPLAAPSDHDTALPLSHGAAEVAETATPLELSRVSTE